MTTTKESANNAKVVLVQKRTYRKDCTESEVWLNDTLFCYMLELAWRNNQRGISCIPLGEYELLPRYTEKRGHHIILANTSPREGILIHSGVDASIEDGDDADSLGCLLPQTAILTTKGKTVGVNSRPATKALTDLCYSYFRQKRRVFLKIVKEEINA